MSHRILAALGPNESPAMVAAALEILASMAGSSEARNTILAPWAWELRQKARALENAGARATAAEAKAIARVVSAVALGKISSADLTDALSAMKVDEQARLAALGVLRFAMHS